MRWQVSALALLVGLLPAMAAADPVAVRAGARGSGARLVFDWPAAVDHSARVEGNRLVIRFAREAEADIAALPGLVGSWVSGATRSADGRQVILTLKKAASVSSFSSGTRVVVDIAPAAVAAAKPTPPVAPSASPTPRPAPAATAAVEQPVRIRTGRHNGFDRVVVETGAPVTLRQEGQVVTLGATVPRRLSEAQLAQLKLPQVETVTQQDTPGAFALTLTLKPGASLSSFRVPKGIGLDLKDVAAAPVTTDEKPAMAQEKAAEAVAPAAKPAPETKPVAETKPPAEAKPVDEPVVTEAKPAPAAQAKPVAETAAPSPEATPAPAPQAAPAVAAVETAPLAAAVLPPLEMSVPAATPVAVFRRGPSLFVVVNEKDTPRELIPLIGSALAATDRVSLVNAQGGRVIRISLGDLRVSPVVTATATGWQVAFPAEGESKTIAMPVVEEPDYSTGARVLVKTATAAGPVFFADPLVGDTLIVVPVGSAANGLQQRYRFAEAELMPSLHGVVVRPWADTLNVISTSDGVALATTGGLKLAERLAGDKPPLSDAPKPADGSKGDQPAFNMPALFDFRSMGKPAGEKYAEELMKLQDNIGKTEVEKKDYARLELANFYFMNGMPTEANALWTLASQTTPELSDLPDFKLIRAIAAFSSGSLQEAEAALAAANQPTTDSALWQAMLAVKKRDWVAAYDNFRGSVDRIWDYPEPYRSRLALAAIETAINTQDYGQAQMLLSTLSGLYRTEKRDVVPAMEYLGGLLDWNNNRYDRARAQFGSAAQSWNQYWRTRAELALIDADIKEAKVPLADIMRRVERMRYAWRGDALEFDILHRLAKLHVQTGAYAAAFDDYAQLVEKFPDDPRTAGLTDEQKAAFEQIFQGEARDQSPAFSQLAVWERYPQFRPTQPAVLDSINTYMADRVAAIDLLSRAAEFHGDVLKGTKDIASRAAIGLKMAGLYALDGKYDKALAALTETEPAATADQPSVLSDAQRDARRMLKARALFGSGKAPEALDLLKDDYSDPATRLRADIFWKTRKWSEAAIALDALVGPPPAAGTKLDGEKTALILRRATALALAADRAGIADMRVKFGEAMAATPDANTFQLLTRPEMAGGLPDRATLSGRVAEVDLFQKFLEQYRASAKPAAEASQAVAGSGASTPEPAAH